MNTMRYLCSLFGASTDDLVTAETPAGFKYQLVNQLFSTDLAHKVSSTKKSRIIAKTDIYLEKVFYCD